MTDAHSPNAHDDDAPAPGGGAAAQPPASNGPIDDAPGLRGRARRAAQRLRPYARYFPYASLSVGVLSALLMDRSPQVASGIVVLALLGFFFAFALALLTDGVASPGEAPAPANSGSAKATPSRRVLYFVLLWVLQSALCQVLFFVIPHYARTMQLLVGHVLFAGSALACGVILLWDPLFERVMGRPILRFTLVAYVVFVGLNAVLPALGFQNSTSLVLSAVVAAIGGGLFAGLRADPGQRAKTGVVAFVVSSGLLIAAAILGAAALLPPAPLQLGEGGLGTEIVEHALSGEAPVHRGVPEVLYCHSSIIAPRGLTDGIVHVWTWEGTETDRIPLSFSGGRLEGFRTFSKKERLRPGRIGCAVETAFGQQLGAFSTEILQDLAATD